MGRHETMAQQRMIQQNKGNAMAGCLSWSEGGKNGGAGGNTSRASSVRSSASDSGTALSERIAQAKMQCQVLYEQGRKEELDELVALIGEMEKKMSARGGDTQRSTSQNTSRHTTKSSRRHKDQNGFSDVRARKAFFEAKDSAQAFKDRNTAGENP